MVSNVQCLEMSLETFETLENKIPNGDIQELANNRPESSQLCAAGDEQASPEACVDNGKRPSLGLTDQGLSKILLTKDFRPLGDETIQAPSMYIQSLPAKGVRSKIIDAMNVWLSVPEQSKIIIKQVVDELHESSLMLDDIQDSSKLRRGMPSTHTIFGLEQTINSASYKITQALDEALKLENMGAIRIILEELKKLYIGQSLDLYWTCNLVCPPVEELIKALESKTGGLFRMLFRLMEATSTAVNKPNLDFLTTLLGRHFAIRDDYQNLRSDEYGRQKGFCNDLDEGKYSLPIIHALLSLPENQSMVLRNMLTQRRVNGKSSPEHKQLILQLMEQAGSLDYTLAALRLLQFEIYKEIGLIEDASKIQNEELRALLSLLFI